MKARKKFYTAAITALIIAMTATTEAIESGLNPEFSVTPIQNTKPVPAGDKLPNMTATSAIVI